MQPRMGLRDREHKTKISYDFSAVDKETEYNYIHCKNFSAVDKETGNNYIHCKN